MTCTPHGHHINGTTRSDEPHDLVKAKCGGPGRCRICNISMNKAYKDGLMSVIKVFAPKQKELRVAKVTDADLEEIARWCGGRVRDDHSALMRPGTDPQRYIDVPINYRLVRVDVDDYILKDGNTFSVLPANTFEMFFEEV